MNDDRLVLTSEKFKKLNKRVLEQLTELDSTETLKLSKVQEIMSKSLGFRDYHELKSRVESDAEPTTLPKSKTSLLNNLNEEGLSLLLFENLAREYGFDMWIKRAKLLLTVVLKVIRQKQKEGFIQLITTADLKKYIRLEELTSTAKNTTDPVLKSTLLEYFADQPGFNMSDDGTPSIIQEQHSYLETQIRGLVKELEKVESNDFYVFKTEWILGFKSLNYPDIVEPIRKLDFFEDSWFGLIEFREYLALLNEKGKLKSLLVSDLLFNSTQIIAPARREALCKTIRNIISNYELASKMSSEMVAAAS